jgi:hypothetical protein
MPLQAFDGLQILIPELFIEIAFAEAPWIRCILLLCGLEWDDPNVPQV